MLKFMNNGGKSGVIIFFLILIFSSSSAEAKLKVIATTEDIASLVRSVGRDLVEVESLTRGYQDVHFVEAKPSLMVKMNRADLLIYQGLELEVGWLPLLIRGSRNPKLLPGRPGNLDLSISIDPIEIPKGVLDRSMGDVHPHGNPHYPLGPANIKPMVYAITDQLSELDPKHTSQFKANRNRFVQNFESRLKTWEETMKPFRNTKVIIYHRTWSYFLHHFGIQYIGTVEPKPGILPSPSHLIKLVRLMKKNNVNLILQANYYQSKFPDLLAKKTGAKVLVLPTAVGGIPKTPDTIKLFDYLVSKIADELSN